MYTTFYNLRGRAFRLTSDPRFFHSQNRMPAALATVSRQRSCAARVSCVDDRTYPRTRTRTTGVSTRAAISPREPANNHPISSAFILNPTLSSRGFLGMLSTPEFEIPCTSTSSRRVLPLFSACSWRRRERRTSLLLGTRTHSTDA